MNTFLGRQLVLYAAAGAAAFLLARMVPESLSDGFRQTLCLVPLVIVALRHLEAAGRRLGGRGVSRRASTAQGFAAAVAVLAGLRLPELGLPLGEPVLIAGLTVILLWRTAGQTLALRPLVPRLLKERQVAGLFFLPLVVYLALLPWTTGQRQPDGDEPYYLLVTHSLAYDLDAELTNNYADGDWRHFMDHPIEPQPGDPVGPDGQVYSRHNKLLPIFLTPAYRLFGEWGALGMMVVLTALLALQTLAVALRYRPKEHGAALLAYGLFAFAPPLLLYSGQVWTEVPAAVLILAALEGILRLRRNEGEGEIEATSGANHRIWLLVGVALLLLPLLKIRFVLPAASLLLLTVLRRRVPWKPLAALGAALGLLSVGILAFNQLKFGNPLKIYSTEELALHERSLASFFEGGLGHFFDSAFGLFPSSPLWILLIPALVLLCRQHRRLLWDIVLVAGPYLLIASPRLEWYGGWSPPFRYALCILPLLAVALTPLLADRRRPGARFLLAALGLMTVLATLAWTAVPGWTYSFADGRTHLLDHLSRQVGADAAVFFPSYVRPRLASWLWPPLLCALTALLWWWPRRGSGLALRRAEAAGVALVFLLGAALPVITTGRPTTVVEAEDPWVGKNKGQLFPDRWITERPRYRGGWILRPGESLTVPVAAGGTVVSIDLDVRFIRNQDPEVELFVYAGGELLDRWRPPKAGAWLSPALGPFTWIEGESLTLALDTPAGAPAARRHRPSGLHVDRIRLRWLDEEGGP